MSLQAPSPAPAGPPPPPIFAEARPQFYIKISKPMVTRILLVVILVVYVGEVVLGFVLYRSFAAVANPSVEVLVLMGAKVNDYIAQGEVWRLFTAIFLHGGILHLMFNLYALYALGPLLEGYTGHIRYTAIFLISGLYGSLFSYALSGPISVGASGAIFGLLGGTSVYFLKYHNNFGMQGRAILQNMAIVLVLNLVIGFSSGFIDNWGHIGGLVGGAVVTFGIMPRYRQPAVVRLGPQPLEVVDRRVQEAIWVVLCLLLLVIGVYATTAIRFGG